MRSQGYVPSCTWLRRRLLGPHSGRGKPVFERHGKWRARARPLRREALTTCLPGLLPGAWRFLLPLPDILRRDTLRRGRSACTDLFARSRRHCATRTTGTYVSRACTYYSLCSVPCLLVSRHLTKRPAIAQSMAQRSAARSRPRAHGPTCCTLRARPHEPVSSGRLRTHALMPTCSGAECGYTWGFG